MFRVFCSLMTCLGPFNLNNWCFLTEFLFAVDRRFSSLHYHIDIDSRLIKVILWRIFVSRLFPITFFEIFFSNQTNINLWHNVEAQILMYRGAIKNQSYCNGTIYFEVTDPPPAVKVLLVGVIFNSSLLVVVD